MGLTRLLGIAARKKKADLRLERSGGRKPKARGGPPTLGGMTLHRHSGGASSRFGQETLSDIRSISPQEVNFLQRGPAGKAITVGGKFSKLENP